MTPEKTYAIIVGIESYRLPQSDLDGPGEDAVEFVKWLRNNGVPASNIFLFLSLLEKNVGTIQARLRSVGIDVVSQPAIRTLIENCLKELGNPITYSGELLYLFWGGGTESPTR